MKDMYGEGMLGLIMQSKSVDRINVAHNDAALNIVMKLSR
jgi:hypothetical protein